MQANTPVLRGIAFPFVSISLVLGLSFLPLCTVYASTCPVGSTMNANRSCSSCPLSANVTKTRGGGNGTCPTVQWSFRATGFQTSSHHISVTWTMPQNSDGPKLRGCPENAFCAMYLWGSSNYGGSRLPSGLSFAETRNRGGGASGPVVVTTVSNERAFATLMNDGSIRTWGEYGENGCTGQNGEQGCTGPPSEVTSPSVPGFVPVSSIASGAHAFAALRTDGTLRAWGEESSGGDNIPPSLTLRSDTNFVEVQSIVGNGGAFVAIKRDGTAQAWGSAAYGGDAPLEIRDTTHADFAKVSFVASNYYAFALVKETGAVVAFGDSDNGGAGIPTSLASRRVVGIASTWHAFAALREDGAVQAWGDSQFGGNSPDVVENPSAAGFVSTVVISASQYAFAALRSDGTVRGWGHTAIPYFGGQPLQVPSNLVTVSSPVLQIVANSYAFAALKADGSVVCFGYPTFGGSGVPTFPARVVSIFETARAFAALLADGTVKAWGSGDFGASGVPVSSTPAIALASGVKTFAMLLEDGSVRAWPSSQAGGTPPAAVQIGGNITVLSIAATWEAYAALVRVDWPAGAYLDASSAEPQIKTCPRGFNSSGAPSAIGLSSCAVTCPAGEITIDGACQTCPTGTYRAVGGINICQPCSAGHYQDSAGQQNCKPCPIGRFGDSTGLSSIGQCSACLKGKFAASPGSGTCASCAEGKYQDALGSTDCKSCTNRTHVNARGSTAASACQACPPGTVFDGTTNAFPCSPCGPGMFRDNNRTDSLCEQCVRGKYSSMSRGSASCISCPPGKKGDFAGVVSCRNCTAGYYAPGIGRIMCFPCHPGKFAHTTGMVSCLPCRAGRYTTRSGETSRDCEGVCAKGRYGGEGASKAECTATCEKGFYSLDAASSCIECPAGRYGDSRGLADPGCSGPCDNAPAKSTSCGPVGAAPSSSPRSASKAPAPTPSPTQPKEEEDEQRQGTQGDDLPTFLLVAGVVFLASVLLLLLTFLQRSRSDSSAVTAAELKPKEEQPLSLSKEDEGNAKANQILPVSPTQVHKTVVLTGRLSRPAFDESMDLHEVGIGNDDIFTGSLKLGEFTQQQQQKVIGMHQQGLVQQQQSMIGVQQQQQSTQQQQSMSAMQQHQQSIQQQKSMVGMQQQSVQQQQSMSAMQQHQQSMQQQQSMSAMPQHQQSMQQQQSMSAMQQYQQSIQQQQSMIGMQSQQNVHTPEPEYVRAFPELAQVSFPSFPQAPSNQWSPHIEIGVGGGARGGSDRCYVTCAERVQLWQLLKIPPTAVSIGQELGRGKFGMTNRGSFGPTPCAIKTIFTARIDALALERQIKIMACLNHPSTVRLLAWIEIPGKVGLVLELCAGDLRSFYSGRLDHVVQSKYSDQAGLTAAMSIVNGMAYVHAMGMIHRDLKSENVLITVNGQGKVAEFGKARETLSNGASAAMTIAGTELWMAPEVARSEAYNSKCDTYSFGVVLLEIVKRDLPFTKGERQDTLQTMRKVVTEGLRPSIPENTNSELANIIKQCWCDDATKRPTFAQLQALLPQVTALRGTENKAATSSKALTDAVDNMLGVSLWRKMRTVPSQVVLEKRLGQGASADVHKATFRGSVVAVKIFRGINDEESRDKAFSEIELLFELRHPCIIGIFAWFETNDGRLGAVLEFAPRGDLYAFYREGNSAFSELRGLQICKDVAEGVAYMHSFPVPIIHRDLKSPNVLINDSFNGQVADCGVSRRLTLGETMTMTAVGSTYWAAPEIMAGERYNTSVDVYSFGTVLYEVLLRELPFRKEREKFQGRVNAQIGVDIAKGLLRPIITEEAAQARNIDRRALSLHELCCNYKPYNRPSMATAVQMLEDVIKRKMRVESKKSTQEEAEPIDFTFANAEFLAEVDTAAFAVH